MSVLTWRRIHRYLGIVVGVQLVLWTAGGLFWAVRFSLADRSVMQCAMLLGRRLHQHQQQGRPFP